MSACRPASRVFIHSSGLFCSTPSKNIPFLAIVDQDTPRGDACFGMTLTGFEVDLSYQTPFLQEYLDESLWQEFDPDNVEAWAPLIRMAAAQPQATLPAFEIRTCNDGWIKLDLGWTAHRNCPAALCLALVELALESEAAPKPKALPAMAIRHRAGIFNDDGLFFIGFAPDSEEAMAVHLDGVFEPLPKLTRERAQEHLAEGSWVQFNPDNVKGWEPLLFDGPGGRVLIQTPVENVQLPENGAPFVRAFPALVCATVSHLYRSILRDARSPGMPPVLREMALMVARQMLPALNEQRALVGAEALVEVETA